MCNCSSFDGYYDDDFDGFIRTKAGKKRRKRKKELRESGLSRKEARKQALAEIPRTKKKRQAVKLAKAEERAMAEGVSVGEVLEAEAPEMAELMDEGLLSSDPKIASMEIAEVMGGEKVKAQMIASMGGGLGIKETLSDPTFKTDPVVSMTDIIEEVGGGAEDPKIMGIPQNTFIIGAVVVVAGGFFLMRR